MKFTETDQGVLIVEPPYPEWMLAKPDLLRAPYRNGVIPTEEGFTFLAPNGEEVAYKIVSYSISADRVVLRRTYGESE